MDAEHLGRCWNLLNVVAGIGIRSLRAGAPTERVPEIRMLHPRGSPAPVACRASNASTSRSCRSVAPGGEMSRQLRPHAGSDRCSAEWRLLGVGGAVDYGDIEREANLRGAEDEPPGLLAGRADGGHHCVGEPLRAVHQ